jgi:hypothetical protein
MTAPVPQPCQQWRLKLAATHPADLEPAERAALEAHIATCAGCAAAYAAYLRLDAAVQRLPGPAPLEGLPPKLLALWAAEDQQEQNAHAPVRLASRERPLRSTVADTRSPVFPERPAPRRPSLRLASGLTALAAVLVIALVTAALLTSRLHGQGSGPTGKTVGVTQTSQTGVTPTWTTTATPTPGTTYPVEVFFSRHPGSDNNPSLVYPVQRTAPNLSVATFALKQLFLGPTAAEQAEGYYSDFMGNLGTTNYCSDKSNVFTISLNHRGTKPEAGTATVMLCVQVSLPGDLSGARMKAMITQTVLQFPNNKNVVILNYQGNCFDDLKGGNDCLRG